jgi:hypothetical protein
MGYWCAVQGRVVVGLILTVLAAASILAPMQSAAAEPADRVDTQVSDFDGDGFADVVVGGEGAIYVIYGAATGLQPKRHQRWTIEDLPSGSRVINGGIGTTGTAGDFDGDGFSDLAMQDEGVHVLYGSAAGLTVERSTYFPIAVNSGALMASGNFGRSRHADLAIGAPVDDSGSRADSGAVTVLYGSVTGLTMSGHQEWSQDSLGIRGTAENGDGFGDEVVAADFGRSGYDDLAIGVPDEWPIGAVNVIYGSAAGLTAAGNQLWTPRSKGLHHLPDDVEGAAPWSMMSLAAGHFAGRRYADLAIGAPSRRVADDDEYLGTVNVIYGSASGLTPEGNQLWTERIPGVLGKAGTDGFGGTLTAGNFGRDLGARPFDDLAIGAPDNGPGDDFRGAVHVLYGTATGLTVVGNQLWKQNTPGVPGASEGGDFFGSTMTDADFGRNPATTGYDDLVVGVPGEDLNGDSEDEGRVLVFYGTEHGLTATSIQSLSQKSLGAPPEREDFGFGLGLTASSTTDQHN